MLARGRPASSVHRLPATCASFPRSIPSAHAPGRVCRCLKKPLAGAVASPSHFSLLSQTVVQAQPLRQDPATDLSTEAGIARGTSASLPLHSRKKLRRSSFTARPPSSLPHHQTAFRGSHLPNCSCLLLSTCSCPLSILEAESGPSLGRLHTIAPQVPGSSLEHRPSKDLSIIARRLFSSTT